MQTQPQEFSRVRKRNVDTRDNLVKVGVRMLHESGYTGTGIKDIVGAADVPKGSFYNHFDSKEVFGKEVVDAYFHDGFIASQPLFENASIAPLTRLRRYFDERIQAFQEIGYTRGCLMGNLSLEIADHSTLIRDNIAEHFQTWSKMFETCISEAQETGAIRSRQPASLIAQFVLNSWEGALLRMRVDKSDKPLRDFTEVVFGSILI
jgi:TetR/AcrR family transcriptional regulator, transcriptional repressor for nem operon